MFPGILPINLTEQTLFFMYFLVSRETFVNCEETRVVCFFFSEFRLRDNKCENDEFDQAISEKFEQL